MATLQKMKLDEHSLPAQTRFALQMTALLGLAQCHSRQLAVRDFGPARIEAMAAGLLLLKQRRAAYVAALSLEVRQRRLVRAAFAAVMAFRQELTLCFRLAMKDQGDAPPPIQKRASFATSPGRCLRWLHSFRPVLLHFAGQLAASLPDPVGCFDALAVRLSQALLAQTAATRAVIRCEEELRNAREAMQGLADRLRVSGRLAFKDQPQLLRRLSRKHGQRRRSQPRAQVASAAAPAAVDPAAVRASAGTRRSPTSRPSAP